MDYFNVQKVEEPVYNKTNPFLALSLMFALFQ